ncbi:MAG: D-2-hydroxyacid dehydrogenase [Ruminococcaceae bacterium]|nr:D-2-hydroxyacid dehydrogenase [Oscillospiraceae bacterium]
MKIVILDGYASNPGDLSWQELEKYGTLTVYERTTPEEVASRIDGAQIVLLNKTPLTAEAIEQAKDLRMVGVLATGYNIVDIDAAKRCGVTVCNVPGYSTQAVVQMTLALLLECTQQVGLHNTEVHSGTWQSSPDFCFWKAPLIELAGKTLGIIGCGAIGSAVKKAAEALGMLVIFTGRTPREDKDYVSLDALLAQSDVISLHCPQTAENLHMIDAAAINQMKDGVIVINTARGGLVDEAAIADALNCGKMAYYAADVVSKEPIAAGNPLLAAKNCILTPHIAWAPRETRERLHHITAENVRMFLNDTPQNTVN